MSLIYSALSKLEPVAPATSVLPPAHAFEPPKTSVPRSIMWLLLGCAVIVLAGYLLMSLLRGQFAPSQVPAPVKSATAADVAAVVAKPPVLLTPPAALIPLVLTAPAGAINPASRVAVKEIASAVSAAAQQAAALTDSAPAGTAHAPEPNPVAKPAVRLHQKAQARAAATPTVASTPEQWSAEESNQLTQAIKGAIQAGHNEETEKLLAQLGARLPPESITLLNLRAWYKLQSGHQAEAMSLYRQIVARIPGDETASINLALLHWKAGQQDEARRLINNLIERHPESESAQAYGRQFGALK